MLGAGIDCQTPFILYLFPEHPPKRTKVSAHFWEVMHCIFSLYFIRVGVQSNVSQQSREAEG